MNNIKTITNDKGEVYFVCFEINPYDGNKFLQELWDTTNGWCFDDCKQEITDRRKGFRTRYDGTRVVIYTHAFDPVFDTDELHRDVLGFLKDKQVLK